MSKLRVNIDYLDGPAVADQKAKWYIYFQLNQFDGTKDQVFTIGTDVMLGEIRLALLTDKQDLLPFIEFWIGDQQIHFDEYSHTDDWNLLGDRNGEIACEIAGICIERSYQKKAKLLAAHPQFLARYLAQNDDFRIWYLTHPEYHTEEHASHAS